MKYRVGVHEYENCPHGKRMGFYFQCETRDEGLLYK